MTTVLSLHNIYDLTVDRLKPDQSLYIVQVNDSLDVTTYILEATDNIIDILGRRYGQLYTMRMRAGPRDIVWTDGTVTLRLFMEDNAVTVTTAEADFKRRQQTWLQAHKLIERLTSRTG